MPRKGVLFGLVVLMATMVVSPRLVAAKKRVVVLYFDGSEAAYKPVRNYIRYVVLPKAEELYEEVSKKEVAAAEGVDASDKAARKQWWKDKSPEELAELAKKYSISIFIYGEGKKKGRKKVVTLVIYNGNGFEEVARKDFTFRRAIKKRVEIKGKKKSKQLPPPKVQDEVGVWLLEQMEKVPEYVPEEEQAEPEKPVEQVEDKEAEEVLKEPETTTLAARPKAKEKEKTVSGPAKLEAGLMLDIFSRDLEFSPSSEPYLKTKGMVTMPTLQVLAYPLLFVFKPSNPLAGLGINFELGMVFGMKTHPADDKDQNVDTTVTSLAVGLGYRYRIGPVWLEPRFEYKRFQWTYATPALIDSPGVTYSYLEPSFGARFMMLGDRLGAGLRFGIALPLAVGDIADGTYYGQATAYGIHTEIGASYEVLPMLKVGAGVRWLQMSFDFKGNGLRRADSATDSILSFLLSVRYQYR